MTIGGVVSIKTNKTATVLVTRTATHPLYKKSFVRSKKYAAHDEVGINLGDIVEIEKIKPISKTKHWLITRIVGKSIEELASAHLQEKGAEAIAQVMPEEEKTNGTA